MEFKKNRLFRIELTYVYESEEGIKSTTSFCQDSIDDRVKSYNLKTVLGGILQSWFECDLADRSFQSAIVDNILRAVPKFKDLPIEVDLEYSGKMTKESNTRFVEKAIEAVKGFSFENMNDEINERFQMILEGNSLTYIQRNRFIKYVKSLLNEKEHKSFNDKYITDRLERINNKPIVATPNNGPREAALREINELRNKSLNECLNGDIVNVPFPFPRTPEEAKANLKVRLNQSKKGK